MRAFLLAVAERAGKTAIQTFIAVATVGGVFDLAHLDWTATLVAAASAAVLSVLTSLLSAKLGPSGSPSLVADPAAAKGVDPVVELADRDARRKDPLT